MIPLDIKTHHNASYFEPFNTEEVYEYKYAWGGKILSYLGWATSLNGTDGKVHYFKRQDLKDWMALHQRHKKGTYHVSVAEICTKQVLENKKKAVLDKLKKFKSHYIKAKSTVIGRQFINGFKIHARNCKDKRLKREKELEALAALKQTCREIASKRVKRKVPVLVKKFISNFIIHAKKCKATRLKKEQNLKELVSLKEAFKKIKFCYTKAKTVIIVKKIVSRLKNSIKINNDLRLSCVKNNTYLITIADRQIVAQPARMQTSRYFCHFLDFKEKNKRLINVPLELFAGVVTSVKKSSAQSQSFVVDGQKYTRDVYNYQLENIEIDQEIFNIIKIFLEGKKAQILPQALINPILQALTNSNPQPLASPALQDPPQALANPALQNPPQPLTSPVPQEKFEGERDIAKLITPYHFEGLYKFHCLFDISGIMDITYDTIDFYSEKQLNWNGKEVSANEYWTTLAQKIGDKHLERLCEQKYSARNLVQAALTNHIKACMKASNQDYIAANASSISCKRNTDGTLNLILHFGFDSNFQSSFDPNYYQKYFSLFANWTPEQWQHASISTLTLDLSKLTTSLINAHNHQKARYISYFYHLIKAINQHLIIPSQQVGLVIQSGHRFFLDNLSDDEHKNLIITLGELLNKYSRVTFSPFESKWNKGFYHSLPDQLAYSSSKKNLFSLFSLENAELEACCSYKTFSATLKSAAQSSQKMIIQYEPNKLDLQPFTSIEAPFDLILDPIGQTKEVWQVTHLNKLKVQKLTVKNKILNSTFVKEIKDSKNLMQLEMTHCQLTPDYQKELNEIISHKQKIFKKNQHFEKAIELNKALFLVLPSHYRAYSAAKSCDIQYTADLDGASHLTLNFKFDHAYTINSYANAKHYKQLFSFLFNHLSAAKTQEISGIEFSSLTLNISQLLTDLAQAEHPTIHYISYLGYLLRDINKYIDFLCPGKRPKILIEGLPHTFLEDLHFDAKKLDKQDGVFIQYLKKSLEIFSAVHFSLAPQEKNLNNLLNWLKTLTSTLHFSCSILNHVLTIQKPDPQSNQQKMTLCLPFDQNSFNLRELNWIPDFVHLILQKKDRQPWTASNLKYLQTKELTIENTILDQRFIHQLNEALERSEFKLSSLNLKNCQINPEIKTQLEESLSLYNAVLEEGEEGINLSIID